MKRFVVKFAKWYFTTTAAFYWELETFCVIIKKEARPAGRCLFFVA